ncbi:hypothetical protein ACLOJK_019323 [Asimina triloba]
MIGSASVDLHSSSEGCSGSLFLEGTPQVIDLEEEEGGPASSSVPVGESKLFTLEGSGHETTEGDREAKLYPQCEVARAKAVQLQEELESSQYEVAHLRTSLQGGDSTFTVMFIDAEKSTNALTTPKVDT